MGKLGRSYRLLEFGEKVLKGDIEVITEMQEIHTLGPVMHNEYIFREVSPYKSLCFSCGNTSLDCEVNRFNNKKVRPNYYGDSNYTEVASPIFCPKCSDTLNKEVIYAH